MDTFDVLVAARAEVEKGWCQRWTEDLEGNVCALGGLRRVLEHFTTHHPAYEALVEALPSGFERQLIGEFNDSPSTTKADVLALYDRTIAAEAVKATSDPSHVYALA